MRRRRRGRRASRRPAEGRRAGASGPARGLAVLSAALLLWACGGDDRDGGDALSDSVYVEVMARLVVLDSALSPAPEVGSDGPTRTDSLRARILESWGVNADQLLDYARTRGDSPERMEAVWSRVHELSDSLADAGWSPGEAPATEDSAGGDADPSPPADDAAGTEDDTAGGDADTVPPRGDADDTAGGALRPPGPGAAPAAGRT